MFFGKYLPKIKVSEYDKREYKAYLRSKGLFKALKKFLCHIWYILINYGKLSKSEKQKSYIYVYYDPADYPILSIDHR